MEDYTNRLNVYAPEFCLPDPAANSDYMEESRVASQLNSLNRSTRHLLPRPGTDRNGSAWPSLLHSTTSKTHTSQLWNTWFASQRNLQDTHFSALEYLVPAIACSTDSLALELTLLSTRQHSTTRPGLTFSFGSPSEHARRHACGTLHHMHNAVFASQHNPGIWNWLALLTR